MERPFAHQFETGGLRRVWVRGHENVRKRVLIQAAGCNLGLLLRRPDRGRHAPEPAGAGAFGHFGRNRASDGALGASDARLGGQMDTGGARSLNRSSPSCVTGPTQRTDFFHGLLGGRPPRVHDKKVRRRYARRAQPRCAVAEAPRSGVCAGSWTKPLLESEARTAPGAVISQ